MFGFCLFFIAIRISVKTLFIIYSLPTTYYLLPTTYYLLPTTYYLRADHSNCPKLILYDYSICVFKAKTNISINPPIASIQDAVALHELLKFSLENPLRNLY
jgi:hypothetical protein